MLDIMPFNGSVLQVIPALDAGGAERTTVEIARALVAAGGKALVASAGGRLEGEIEACGGRVFRMPVESKNPITIWRNGRRLADLIRAENVDLVHVRSRAPAWSTLWAAKATGIKSVSTYHGHYGTASSAKRLYNSGLLRTDLVIANSEFTAKTIRESYELALLSLKIVPRGADLDHFNPVLVTADRVTALTKAWRIDSVPDTVKLLAPGRLTAWKGQEDLVAALGILSGNSSPRSDSGKTGAGQYAKFQLVFCGDAQGRDAFEQTLRDKIRVCGVDSMTHIVGHCADMPAAYHWADAVIAPSRRPEAFGRVVVEAGAMSKPVIASNHGGGKETIIDQQTGVLIPPHNPDALAKAIMGLADDPAACDHMGLAARAHVTENYSIDAMCSSTLRAYQSLGQI